MDKLHQEIARLKDSVTKLLEDINDMKCCANCMFGGQRTDGCYAEGRVVLQDQVCKEWKFDCATHENRDINL